MTTQDKFLQSSTATNRSIASRLTETASVKDFGSLGDGVSDDTAAIQACVDYLAIAGGTATIPNGTYIITSAIVLPRSPNVSLVGESAFHTIIENTSATTSNVIEFDTTSTGIVSKCRISDLQLKITNAGNDGIGLHMSNNASGNGFRWMFLENLYLLGNNVTGSVGVQVEGAQQSTFNGVISRDFDFSFKLLKVNKRSSANTFISCTGHTATTANWFITGCRTSTFIRCRTEGTSTNAFYLNDTASGQDTLGNSFIHCSTEDDHAGADFHLENVANQNFIATGVGTNSTGDGFTLIGADQCSFTGCLASDHVGVGKFSVKIDAASVSNVFYGMDIIDNNYEDLGIAGVLQLLDANYPTIVGKPNATSVISLDNTNNNDELETYEAGLVEVDATAGNTTILLPRLNSRSHRIGIEVEYIKTDASANVVGMKPTTAGGGDTINGSSSALFLTAQWESAKFRAGNNGWVRLY